MPWSVLESDAASAGWMLTSETPTNSAERATQPDRGAWERRRTECVLSVRRQVQSGVVGVDTVICLRLYGQMRAGANVYGEWVCARL